MKLLLQKILDVGILIVWVVFPITLNIALVSPLDWGHPVVSVNMSIADLLMALLLLTWAIKVSIYSEWKTLIMPHVSILAFTVILLISVANAFSLTNWLKEIIQLTEYLLIFYMLILNNLKTVRVQTIRIFVFATTTNMLIVSMIQAYLLDADVFLIRGVLSNHNTLGAFLCIVVPVVYNEILCSKSRYLMIWGGTIVICSLLVITVGSTVIALFVGMIVISWFHGTKVLMRFLLGSFIWVGIFCWCGSTKNIESIKRFYSIYEIGSINSNYYRVLNLNSLEKYKIYDKKVGDNILIFSSEKYTLKKVNSGSEGERYLDMEQETHIKNQFLEMAAAINMISENLILGVGCGNFQQHIGTYYRSLPKVNTTEPNQHNGFLLVASTTGILGLSALVWIFYSTFKIIYVKLRESKSESFFLVGISGGMTAALISHFFTDIFISDLFVPLVFILCIPFMKIYRLNGKD